ncbi:MAG TPA: hypothetical protein VN643_05465 [Pyrinomonadaceae bacterium]|nr:hypothetical protein [Pyrinomonadaceae bacterium]
MTLATAEQVTSADKWGSLIRITPFAITKDGSVRHRVTFSKGEMFMLIEFNKEEEFVGWFYGNRMMPSEVQLLPLSRTKFFVDGFPYDKGAPWGEKPVFLEFTTAAGKVTGLILKQETEHRAHRLR